MNSPFKVDLKKKINPGVESGDPYYHTAKIKQVIENNEIKLVVVDDKELISDVIQVNADKCGLRNILKLYAKTGDPGLFSARPCLNHFDATNIPTESPSDILKKLPEDLVDGQSIEEFLKHISGEELLAYFKAKQEASLKSEVKENV